MNDLQRVRKDDLLRFIKWMTDYPELWNIISMDNYVDTDKCIEVIEELEQQGFYLLIPLFLSHNINSNVEKGLDKFIVKKVLESWTDKSIEEISTEFKSILRSV